MDSGQPVTRPDGALAGPRIGTGRSRLARSAVVACGCSVAWAALAGVASVAAGIRTGSVALLAFGLDSVIDGSASAVLVWRFWLELRRERRPAGAERTAARVVAAAMLGVAVYVAAQAARALITGAHPGQSVTGIVLLAGSLAVLPALGYLKLRLAGPLRSRALRGDGVLSVAGAALAGAALLGLAVDRSLGWWQADPAAASLIALFLLRGGLAHAPPSRLAGNSERRAGAPATPTPPGTASSTPDHHSPEAAATSAAGGSGGARQPDSSCGAAASLRIRTRSPSRTAGPLQR